MVTFAFLRSLSNAAQFLVIPVNVFLTLWAYVGFADVAVDFPALVALVDVGSIFGVIAIWA
jgi:hypothetical protein